MQDFTIGVFLWHHKTLEDWYAIKQKSRNQIK